MRKEITLHTRMIILDSLIQLLSKHTWCHKRSIITWFCSLYLCLCYVRFHLTIVQFLNILCNSQWENFQDMQRNSYCLWGFINGETYKLSFSDITFFLCDWFGIHTITQ